MMRVFVRWQRARWLRENPGRSGVLAIAMMPLIYLAPLDRLPIFDNWRTGAAAVTFVSAIALTAICLRDSAAVPQAGVWLFQKGIRIQDAYLARWSIDMGFVLLACLWASIGLAIGSAVHDTLNMQWLLAVIAASALLAVIAGTLLFGAAASGTTRGGDALALLLFVSLLEPLGTMFLPESGRMVAHAFLMPVLETAAAPRRLHENPISAVHAALHITIWCTVWIGFGVWHLTRWRPSPGAR